jgi:hypothetical protein
MMIDDDFMFSGVWCKVDGNYCPGGFKILIQSVDLL